MTTDKIILSASLDAQIAANAPPLTDPVYLRRLAALADAAGLDFILFGQPASGASDRQTFQPDALIMASWLIAATKTVGLVSALSATHTQPFHAARALSAMDILSSGRIGWTPFTIGYDRQKAHFGNLLHLPVNAAYEKASEFVAATQALWDSWDADALIFDKEAAVYLDSGKVRRVNYRGTHFQVMGPLNAARPIQGYPVLVQDDNDAVSRVLSGNTDVTLITAAIPADSKRRASELKTDHPTRVLVKIDARVTADTLQEWHISGGCDGFHILPETMPGDLEAFLGNVVPELQKRGLISAPSVKETLRARLRLPLPVNPYSL